MQRMYVDGFVAGWRAREEGQPLDESGSVLLARTSYVEGYVDGYEAKGICGSSDPIDELNFRSYCNANGL